MSLSILVTFNMQLHNNKFKYNSNFENLSYLFIFI